YASQPEILRYVNHVADRFDLRSDIQFNTRVTASIFDEVTGRWEIETDGGAHVSAGFCIMATGCLSSRNTPDFKGLDEFAGAAYHTGDWPHEGVDFTGKRVGIIGTGSSAIQAIPVIAEQAAHLFVFQRTPNYSIPARNAPLDSDVQQQIKADYDGLRQRASQAAFGIDMQANEASAFDVMPEERQREFETRWEKGGFGYLASYKDLIFNQEANDAAAEFVRDKIRAVVHNPEIAAALLPQTTIGCKRLCLDSGYYETFNRPNVTLVDVSDAPIETITPDGLRARGEAYALDCIVLATGFDAMTGALHNIDIRGRAGQPLKQKWAEGPRMLLGLATAGFPNLFTITGPGSPSVLSNMLPSIEQHVNWIADCIGYMGEHGHRCIEPTIEAEDEWVAHVNEVAGGTLLLSCNSWYLGANVPGKPRVFMPYLGFPPYVKKCNEVAAQGYAGFVLTPGGDGELNEYL
ncbi:MAG: NAD(P)/FAD-dependent oxidoreductase, partial [Candidatus Tectomicrobia bacterium]